MTIKEKLNEEVTIEKFKDIKNYVFIILISFYIIPIPIRTLGSGLFVILLIIPFLFFIMTMIYGIYEKDILFLILVLLLLYYPSTYIFSDTMLLPFCLWYVTVSIIGWYLGTCIKPVSIAIAKRWFK